MKIENLDTVVVYKNRREDLMRMKGAIETDVYGELRFFNSHTGMCTASLREETLNAMIAEKLDGMIKEIEEAIEKL